MTRDSQQIGGAMQHVQTGAITREAQKLENIAQTAQDILFKADTIFPFTVFPDTVEIDRVKVTIKRRFFFGVEKVMSIQTEDILNAEANTGPFYGSVRLWTRYFTDQEHPLMVNYLRNKDARRIKAILQGFIIARNRGIDCNNIDYRQLVTLLNDLGQEGS